MLLFVARFPLLDPPCAIHKYRTRVDRFVALLYRACVVSMSMEYSKMKIILEMSKFDGPLVSILKTLGNSVRK